MATGLKSRVIYKVHEGDTNSVSSWAGTYKLLIRPKSIPSPLGEKNMVDTSTLEDLMETQEEGRRASASVAIQGAMEKMYLDDLWSLEGKKLDIMHLYGTDGKGSIGKMAYVGTVSVSPDEASDDHLTMTATIAVATVPKKVTDGYSVTVSNEDTDDMSFEVSSV